MSRIGFIKKRKKDIEVVGRRRCRFLEMEGNY